MLGSVSFFFLRRTVLRRKILEPTETAVVDHKYELVIPTKTDIFIHGYEPVSVTETPIAIYRYEPVVGTNWFCNVR